MTDPTDAMIAAGMPWLINWKHMRKSDQRSALASAYRDMAALAKADQIIAMQAPAVGGEAEPVAWAMSWRADGNSITRSYDQHHAAVWMANWLATRPTVTEIVGPFALYAVLPSTADHIGDANELVPAVGGEAVELRAAADALVNGFAWSAIEADCIEARDNLNEKIVAVRNGIAQPTPPSLAKG